MSGDEGEADAGAETAPEGDEVAAATDASGSDHASLVFLAGLVAFLASGLAFVADLVTDYPIARSLVVNGVAAAVLVAWAGVDSYRDPDSGVETFSGAVGTALMLVGIYLVLAGVVVAVTSVRHGRLLVGVAMVAGGVPLILGGFIALPIDDVLGSTRAGTAEQGDTDDGDTDDGDTDDGDTEVEDAGQGNPS